MSDTPTPEVDEMMRDIPSPPKTLHIERLARRARRLERERDEGRSLLNGILVSQRRQDKTVPTASEVRDRIYDLYTENDQLQAINAELLDALQGIKHDPDDAQRRADDAIAAAEAKEAK